MSMFLIIAATLLVISFSARAATYTISSYPAGLAEIPCDISLAFLAPHLVKAAIEGQLAHGMVSYAAGRHAGGMVPPARPSTSLV